MDDNLSKLVQETDGNSNFNVKQIPNNLDVSD